ncbi:hypothetical protein CLV62_14916 [Dysgonomonas alginatilytica]|uniref:Uncharacterized protein n=1 Tax=Dysgonomonas alginatilytica TaxID=1605892 RepID=A0A2V3PJN5_9BACT|nr:hypothetical protein [Dysgonomonas alginatilytica]PXV58407.1 hypothetical protein CLV62_14916 [Dysgonomonas alginatilytica]
MTQNSSTSKTEILKEKVISLIKEVNSTHRYSMSRIYGLYNEVFTVAETPQSCASCLIRKVNQLKSWLAEQPEEKEQPNSRETLQSPPKTRGRKAKQH